MISQKVRVQSQKLCAVYIYAAVALVSNIDNSQFRAGLSWDEEYQSTRVVKKGFLGFQTIIGTLLAAILDISVVI